MTNFRTAKYDAFGNVIDDPNGGSGTEQLSGARLIPADGLNWYGATGIGGPLQVATVPAMGRISTQLTAHPEVNTILHIDPVNGDDANPGTRALPKKTRRTSLWTGSVTSLGTGVLTLFKRGTTYIHSDTGGAIEIGANQHIGAYGNPRLPKPILRSLNTATVPYVVGMTAGNNCSISDCTIDAQDVINRSGILVYGDGSADATNRHIRNCTVINVAQTGSTLRAGVRHSNNASNLSSNRTTAYARMYDCDVINTEVIGATYHGFHAVGAIGKFENGYWRGINYLGCTAQDCNSLYDGHGFSAFAMGAVRDVLTGYTLVSGTTYKITTAQVFGGTSGTGGQVGTTAVPNVEIMYQRELVTGTRVWKLRKNTATPTTPAVGEFGFNHGAQEIYLNLGIALPGTATAGYNLDACTDACHGILRNRCLSLRNRWARATTVQEGHGFAFDDFVSDGTDINCESIDNDGVGFSLNRGENNRIINCRAINNKAGAVSGLGSGHLIHGLTAIGSGVNPIGNGNQGLVALNPAIYKFQDSTVVVSGSKLLQYTGSDPTVFLVTGSPDFEAPIVRFEDNVVDPGVGEVSGYGNQIGEGGLVFARGNTMEINDWRRNFGPDYLGR